MEPDSGMRELGKVAADAFDAINVTKAGHIALLPMLFAPSCLLLILALSFGPMLSSTPSCATILSHMAIVLILLDSLSRRVARSLISTWIFCRKEEYHGRQLTHSQ